MPLKLSLKPNEKILINGAVIENCGGRCELAIHNTASLLRQKDILREENATTPAKRIFFLLQMIYISNEQREQRLALFRQILAEFISASPSSVDLVLEINRLAEASDYYAAMQVCRKLIQHEQRILDHGSAQLSSVRENTEDRRESAGDSGAGAH
jgi:flagellar protein FlbT